MKHETDVAYKGGLEKLAEDIGNLRYDALAKFLCALTCKLFNDSEKDRQRGREKLARRLRDAALKLEKATDNINVAWKISAPYEDTWVIVSFTPDMCVNCYYSKDRVDGSFWVFQAEQVTTFHKDEADGVIAYLEGVLNQIARLGGSSRHHKIGKLCLK